MLPLQPQRKRQPAQRSCHTHPLPDAALLLAHWATRPTGSLTIPSTTRCGTARVVVVLDVSRLLVGVLALLAAHTQDTEQRVEERARAAEEAEEKEEQDTKDHTDDDTGDCAAREAGGGLCFGEGAVGAGGDGGLEGDCCCWSAGVCDDDQGR